MERKSRYCRECGSKTNAGSCEICGRRTLPISARVNESDLYILEDDIASKEDLDQLDSKKEKAKKTRENYEEYQQASKRVRTQTKMLQGHEEAYEESKRNRKVFRSERIKNTKSRKIAPKLIIIIGFVIFINIIGAIVSEYEGEISNFIESIVEEDSDYDSDYNYDYESIRWHHNDLFDEYDVGVYHVGANNEYYNAHIFKTSSTNFMMTIIPNSELIFNLADGEELSYSTCPVIVDRFDGPEEINDDFKLLQVYDGEKKELYITIRSYEIDGFEDQFDDLLKYFQDNKFYLALNNHFSIKVIKDINSYPNNYLMELEINLIDEKVTIQDDARNK